MAEERSDDLLGVEVAYPGHRGLEGGLGVQSVIGRHGQGAHERCGVPPQHHRAYAATVATNICTGGSLSSVTAIPS